jgi:hypothetical protein
VVISRRGGKVSVTWDGEEIRIGERKGAVSAVEVRFEYYPYDKLGQVSVPGEVTLERLEIR